MSSLAQYKKQQLVKGLYLGDAGSGKTGSLVSLVEAGYKLRIYDFDNLLGSLIEQIRRVDDKLLDLVYAQTFTDKMKGVDIPLVMQGAAVKVMPFTDGTPKAFSSALKQLNHWKTETEDLGNPATWGPDCIVVIDTLTTMSAAAFRYAQAMNPAAKEPQTYYFSAQQMITNVLALLASESFATNVLVLAHVDYSSNHLNIQKGFPRSIGSALNSQISAFFNCVLLAESSTGKRQIRTNSNGIVDLKNPISHKVPDTLPLETGLATFFKSLKE